MDRKTFGRFGENAVCTYLESRGYTVLVRNYVVKGGEIDIIASKGEILVFAEVKTRSPDSMVNGLEAITRSKQRLIVKTALRYIEKFTTELQPRFDAAEVLVQDGKVIRLNYIENAFDATDLHIFF